MVQAQAATLRRIGEGGLNEASAAGPEGPGPGSLGGPGRRDREVVSTVDIVRHPSEAEQVLRMLPGHLRGLKELPPEAGLYSSQRLLFSPYLHMKGGNPACKWM